MINSGLKKQLITTLILLVSVTAGFTQTDLEKLKERMLLEQPTEKIYDYLNKSFPEVELAMLDGGTFNASDLLGKRVIVNFWFTNCQPCLDEMPILNDIQNALGSEDYYFMAITFQDSLEVANFLQSNDYNFNHVINARPLIDKLGVKFYPKTLILDENLQVVKIEKGLPKEANTADLEKWKQALLEFLRSMSDDHK